MNKLQADSAMDKLREAITDALYEIKAYSLPSVCVRFGLDPGDKDEAFNSKRMYVWRRIVSLSHARLIAVAKAIVSEYPSQALEEAVDLAQPPNRPVSELVRRRIGGALNGVELAGRTPLLDVLRRLFPVDKIRSPYDAFESLSDAIEQHVLRNDDMSNEEMLGHLGAYTCSQARFFRMLEEFAHPMVCRDEAEQARLSQIVNPFLKRDGFSLVQSGHISGFPVYEVCEVGRDGERPLDASISTILSTFDAEGVHEAWTKALARRAADPEGAITSARTLLETVCKRILDELGATYTDREDLPKLYRITAEMLNLAPDQHTEQAFREILGNCHAVVNGLAGLRNRLGDAHGKGRKPVRPLSRHAELAVNLAGTVATFLVATFVARSQPR